MKPIFLFFIFIFIAANVLASELPDVIRGKNILTGKLENIALRPDDKKGSVFIFMSSKCPCSNSHTAELIKLSEQYPDLQFVAIHSNTDEAETDAKKYFEKLQMPFLILQDSEATLANLFKALKTPHSFVVNDHSDIIYQGGVTSSANAKNADTHYLAEALSDFSQNKKIRRPEGRTLGCVIARGKNK